MGINPKQLRSLIKNTLEGLNLYSPEAEELLMGTCAQESHLGTYINQINGPALGIFQMEPATEIDIWYNYVHFNEGLKKSLGGDWSCPSLRRLESDLAYQIVMARLHYRRVRGYLPKVDDLEGQARYWKQFYNTPKGKGTVEEYMKNYKELVR